MTQTLNICLFGPFEMQLEGQVVPRLRSRAGMWLLAILVLRREMQTDRSWLARTLWPDSREDFALFNLRRNLTDLRNALGPHAVRIVSPTPRTLGINLSGPDCSCDVAAFDDAIKRGDACSLECAAALYRGPLLEACTEEWVLREREARERACLEALEQLANHEERSGDLIATITLLRQMLAIDPVCETAVRGLMRTLAASRELASAVEVFRDFRFRIHRDLDAEPDSQTAAVYRSIRSQGRAAASSAEHAEPVPARPPRAHGVPVSMTRLIGRDGDLQALRNALASARLLTLTGPGGVGKTRLAVALALEALEDYSDGVWFVDLGVVTEPNSVSDAVAAALLIKERGDRPQEEALADWLRSRRLLILLDNCEHVVESCAALAAHLLSKCANLRILATSRQSLSISGELVWPVSPLAAPPDHGPLADKDPLPAVIEYAAVELFVDVVRSRNSQFRLSPHSAKSVAAICRRLDGMPLAIEFAAARLSGMSAHELLERLSDRFGLLATENHGSVPRHRTLEAAIDWSYKLLTPREQTLLNRLSVFSGGCDLATAESVCSGSGLDRAEVANLLVNLVDRSVVVSEVRAERTRYRLLETVRSHAAAKLRDSGESERFTRRHLAFFCAIGRQAPNELSGPDRRLWAARLTDEHLNIIGALDRYQSVRPGSAMALRLAADLER